MIVIQRHLERPNKGEIVGRARGGGIVGFSWIVRGRLAGTSLFFCEKFVRYSCINKINLTWKSSLPNASSSQRTRANDVPPSVMCLVPCVKVLMKCGWV
jgi:hypothetical protein